MAPQPGAANYDLIIVGGGINGAGIARDAALRGLSVVLFDKGDVCNGTSWASSRLIHGGLRYLETYQFRVVRECLRERGILLRMAPELVRMETFHLPLEEVQIGLELALQALFELVERQGNEKPLFDFEHDALAGQAPQHIIDAGAGDAGKFAQLGTVAGVLGQKGEIAGRFILREGKIFQQAGDIHGQHPLMARGR